ncbi:YwqG family protein [Macrococcus sp. DPC7161]|uniref:YwqG family protein n=1 Tax=Macrococcus sp. DPC7161 TaxID=2507060 RepID=UPI0013E97241|nr:DUF1963 domain-containing protein [Macrococcus sp. DPC7161]
MFNIQDTSHLTVKEQLAYQRFVDQLMDVELPTRPYIKLTSFELIDETLLSSKVGGTPFLKSFDDIPVDANDEHMALLFQINLSDLPDEQEIIPAKRGLIQFWISADEDLYGCDFNKVSEKVNNRLIYIEDLETGLTFEAIKAHFEELEIDEDVLPYRGVIGFDFELSEQSIVQSASEFHPIMDDIWKKANPDFDYKQNISEHIELMHVVHKTFSSNDVFHQIGGYPFFTQEDPRYGFEDLSDFDTLLIQIDSDNVADDTDASIMWGDCGVCNLFVRHEDLAQMKFDDYIYNWDCL